MKRKSDLMLVKKLYCEDQLDVTRLCATAGISRPTFYHHYNKNKQEWDAEREAFSRLRLAKAQDLRDLEVRHNQMLALFITQMETRLDELKALDTIEALDKLSEYINLYRAIKSPKTHIKKDKLGGAEEALKIIGDLAALDPDKKVGLFLAENAEKIIERIARIS
jgi:AcrR family transcriptional regulator